jgi:hypothetical protein
MLPADAIAEITTNIAALQLDPNAAALNLRRRRAARPGFAASPYGFRARSRNLHGPAIQFAQSHRHRSAQNRLPREYARVNGGRIIRLAVAASGKLVQQHPAIRLQR